MLFIFDWDGTLCDSTHKIATCMIAASESLKLPPITKAEVVNIIGLGLPEAIDVLFPGLGDADVVRLRNAYSAKFLAEDHEPSQLFEGAEQTLQSLKNAGIHIAIATGKSRKGLDRVLKSMQLHDYFDASRCADETASKPNPLMLHELLKQFSRRAEDAVLIGDTEYDMEMAQRADMPRIAVSYGAHHPDRLRIFEPTMCIDRISDVLLYLK